MKMKRSLILLALAAFFFASAPTASAQSKSFNMAKWVEVYNSILKELNRSYVDSLEVGRIQRAAIDAMLSSLDPYTLYVPQEEQEDFQMMLTNTYGGIGAVIYKPDVNGNVLINEPYEGSPAAKAGIRCGDEVVAIDGFPPMVSPAPRAATACAASRVPRWFSPSRSCAEKRWTCR